MKKDVSVNDFVSASILEEQIKQRHIIEFGNKSYFQKFKIRECGNYN